MKLKLIFVSGMLCGIVLLLIAGKTGQYLAKKEPAPIIPRDSLGHRLPQFPEEPQILGQVDYNWKLQQPGQDIISLSHFTNKVLFINIWATWCGPCISEMPGIERLSKRFSNDPNVAFLLITDESIGIVDGFLVDQGYGYEFEDLQFYSTQSVRPVHLGSRIYPTTYIIDKSGIIRYKQVGSAFWDVDEAEQYLRNLSTIDT